jgi:hypothetical protein
MRRITPLALWLMATGVLVGAAGVAQALWAKESFETACFQFVRAQGYTPIPAVPAALKALAATQRKAAVETLGAQAKAYYASDAFRRRWTEAHGGRTPDPEAAETNAKRRDMEQQAVASMDKSLADMEKMIPMMPPAVQDQMRGELAKAKARQAKELARKDARKAAAPAPSGETGVPDPKAALRQALETFLRASDGVDFQAPLTQGASSRLTFSSPAQEAKPNAWKASFRAGREATEAARAYAKAWLTELK